MSITDRIDRITGISPEYRGTVLPAPRSVKIELTGRCNFACSFCARSKVLRPQADMDRTFFENITVEMRAAGVEELGLFYLGESFLVLWLEQAIRHAKLSAGFPYVFLTTNASIAKPQRVRRCFEAGLDSLKFSLNYSDATQFAAIANVKSDLFSAMLYNIKAARVARDDVEGRTGHRGGLYASFIEYDGEQAKRMANVVEEVRPYVDEIYGLPLYSQAEFVGKDERDRGWNVTAGNRGRIGALRDPIPCWSVFTEGHVTFDGKLSACCFDHDGRFNMGDLTEIPFMDAWNSPKFQELRAAHLAKELTGTACEQCVVA